MAQVHRKVKWSHITLVAVLPLALNIFLTTFILVYFFSLEEFLKSPFYYTYYLGPFLWSIYHVLLTGLVSVLLRKEDDSLRRIIGPILGGAKEFFVIAIGLLGLSVLLFQVVEPVAVELAYGMGTMERMLSEINHIPLPAAIYGITVTSFTAGVCEEIIWRGYLQTRLERKLGGRVLITAGIQAALFGLWHFVSIHAVFTAILGFVYGLVYARVRRLAPLMTAHWLGNVIGFSLMYFSR